MFSAELVITFEVIVTKVEIDITFLVVVIVDVDPFKCFHHTSLFMEMADGEGFEPPVPCGTSVFKTGAISQTLPPIRVSVFVDKEQIVAHAKHLVCC